MRNRNCRRIRDARVSECVARVRSIKRFSLPTPCRILISTHYFAPHIGGIEVVAGYEAEHLAASGHDVTILTSAIGSNPGEEQMGRAHVHRVRAGNLMERRFGAPFPLLLPSFVWRAWCRVRASDVVHIHDAQYMSSWVIAFWCRCLRKPTVVTQHVALVSHPNRAVRVVQRLVYRTLGRFVLLTGHRVIVLNSTVAEFVAALGVPSERMTFVPSGVDTRLYRPAADHDERRMLRERHQLPLDTVLGLFVGRFVPKKGFDRVVSAAALDYTLIFVGGDESEVSEELRRSAPEGELVFLGRLGREDLSEVYRACDFFVLPSVAEGFPLSVMEAMASGLPIVMSDEPGYDYYELDRRWIHLVGHGSEPLRSELRSIASDGDRRVKMGQYAFEYASSRFRWDNHCDELLRLYEEAAADVRS